MVKKVLLVDDVSFIVEFEKELVDMLAKETSASITVHTADSVKKGLEKVSQNDYDAVVLDINLPDGLGLDIAKAIRGKSEDTVIAMMTISPDEYESYRQYFDVFLKKPILPDAYRRVLRQMLRL